MTIDKLIARLEWFKGQVGNVEVKVVDGEGEWGFAVTKHMIDDEESETGKSNIVLLDITAEPE